ncbi:SHOCT domain-containing protein [Promicromonospora soli]
MMYWGSDMGGWGYALMALNMVVFWGLLIGGIVLLERYLGGRHRQPPPPATADPKQLLAERFARGEIDEDEYRKRLQVLTRP